MSVAWWLMVGTGVAYAVAGLDQAIRSNWPMAIAFVSWATANISLSFVTK